MNGKKTKKSNHLGYYFIDFIKLLLFSKIFVFPCLLMVQFIKLYRYFLSPILPASCRFYPSCSAYAKESLQRFGFWKGAYLSLWRILKCNPFHPGGFDPVSGEKLPNCRSFLKNQ